VKNTYQRQKTVHVPSLFLNCISEDVIMIGNIDLYTTGVEIYQ